MKKSKALIVILSLSLMLTACQSGLGTERLRLQYSKSNNADQYQYKEDYDILDRGPVAGGSLNLFTTAPDTFNPVLTKNTYTSDFLGFIYEGLTRLDKKQQAVPLLADSWSVSEDGLVWNFHLRDGVKWQDGQPFTAEDVEFTVQTLQNPGIDSVYKPLLLNVATCAAVDSRNFRMVLAKPNSFMPEMMTFPILPKHQFKQKDVLSASKDFKPIGTGPYQFTAYLDNKKITLEANKNWWKLNSGENGAGDGMYIEKININVFNSADDALGGLQTGEVDVMKIESADLAKYRGRTDLIMKKYTSRDFEFMAFNLQNVIMADYSVRKAISLAIDKDELVRTLLPGEAEPADLPVLPESWIADSEGIPVSAEGVPAFTDTTATHAAISARTPKEALLLGGWKESSQGYYKVFGGVRKYLKVDILVNSNNSTRVSAAQAICTQLEQSGITASCTQIEWNDMMNRISTAKYDIVVTGLRIPQIPDISYLYSAGYLPVSLPGRQDIARNISGYVNMQLDTYITTLFNENNPDRKKEAFHAVRQQIMTDQPYIGLYFLRNAMVYSKSIRGPLNPDTWNRYEDMTNWYKPVVP